MRILLVSQEYPPLTACGGIGTYAATIAPALAATGAEVHVLAVGHVPVPSTELVDSVTVHRAPLREHRAARASRSWRRVALAAAVRREARRLGRFDVVEAPDWEAEGALLSDAPLVVRLHSGAAQVLPYVGRPGLDGRLATRIERLAIRRAHVVTCSQAQYGFALETLRVPTARLRRVPYPVAAIDAGPLPDTREILFLGRLEHRKGPATLVRALPALLARAPDARLVLAGADTGPVHDSHRQRLEALAGRLGVSSALRFEEEWGSQAVRERLRQVAIVAAPSRWESFGYAAAEAMAAGRALVASDIPAFRALTDGGRVGHLVDPEDPPSWATTLADLLEDAPRVAALGAAAKRHVTAAHAPALAARETLSAYEHARG